MDPPTRLVDVFRHTMLTYDWSSTILEVYTVGIAFVAMEVACFSTLVVCYIGLVDMRCTVGIRILDDAQIIQRSLMTMGNSKNC